MKFTTEDVKVSPKGFPLACDVDNVELVNCEFISEGDWQAIDFNYKRGSATLKDRIFGVNKSKVKPRPWIDGDTVEASVAAAETILATQLKHIATKFAIKPEELLALGDVEFGQLAPKYCQMINSNCKGVMLYCKTVKDKNGYTKIGRGSGTTTPFLQRMDSGECTLQYTINEIAANGKNSVSKNGVTEKSDFLMKKV